MKKKVISLFMVILLVLSLGACGQESTESGSDTSNEKQFVTVVTGSTGGTYYPVGTIFSTLWNEKLGHKGVVASVQSSGGSVENLNMLKDGEAELGIAMGNLTLFAYKGEGKFKDNKFENVRFVTALWPDVTQIVVTEDANVNSLSDLKGKRFNVGGAGSGTEYSTNLILENVAGITFKDIEAEHLGYFEASSAMQNGQLTGMNAEGGLPTSAVSEVFASKTKVKMLEFSNEDYDKLHDVAPYYGQFTVPSGLYSNLDKDVKTVGIKSTLIASADLDEDLVYELVKNIYENYDEISSSHKALEFVKLEEAIKGLPPVPLHKGAVRYFKEKGIEIPKELLEE
ncbi:MAG: TAXI family TRAP transporter solute-binding subunit [Anaeromicrobium sp.]|uniref:TAXI family TRAP transporter solute-binding subunit n=1 Tax=Anaeromicrobium sp. TaxID=1929132 RepID=UPI0025D61194|nr:TAXI family TRAP transporter solute-binding subunit [Anaeromicrobium sp.]MCT4595806.1 TAXI family TRAP transporter solute-binding subunit [Anaeromicrobium sp.]